MHPSHSLKSLLQLRTVVLRNVLAQLDTGLSACGGFLNVRERLSDV